MYTYKYPRPALTVDCVVFGFDEGELKVLLIQRRLSPYRGDWALPGGFVRTDETIDAAARRELNEEACLENIFLKQLYTFGAVDRDPRERVVSVAHYALVKMSDVQPVAATDAADVRWFPVSNVPKLAFDHQQILAMALARLREEFRHQPVGLELLPRQFTLSQLQNLYQAVLGLSLDKRNFRKKILGFDVLVPLKQRHLNGAHRPAQLYRFDPRKYKRLRSAL